MDGKIIVTTTENIVLIIGTCNIGNSIEDEKSEDTNFFVREQFILETIEKMNCDILTINELRPYRNRINGKMCYPSDFLAKIKNYDYIYKYNNATEMSFANGILYKRSSVFPIKEVLYWLSKTPEIPSDTWGMGFGRTILGVKFLPVVNQKIIINAKPIWVYVTHFGIGEEDKNQNVKILPDLIKRDAGEDDFIILGDFNFFEDREREGSKQRSALVESGFVDVGVESYFSFDETKRCYATFLGFERDSFKSSYESLSVYSKNSSRLDHIFTSQHIKSSKGIVWAENEEQLINRKTPSDHLPLICTIEINFI